jgi:hypothetical protein
MMGSASGSRGGAGLTGLVGRRCGGSTAFHAAAGSGGRRRASMGPVARGSDEE